MICPVLQNPVAFDTKKYASRFLVDCDVDVPVVSYLRIGEGEESAYVTWNAVKKSKSGLAGLDERAIQALVARPRRGGWDPVNVNYRGHKVTIMRRVGDFYTASDLMDPELMEILHNYFDTDTVFVGIPHACFMVASTAPEYICNDFFHAFDEAKEEGVQFFEQIYRVDRGHLTEVLEAMPVGPKPQLKSIKGEGVLWFVAPYRGTFEHLEYLIRGDADSYLPGYCSDPDFGGKVIFEIPSESPPFSQEEVRQLGQFEAMLNAIAVEKGLVSMSGRPVVIRIRFSQRVKTVSALNPDALRKLRESAREYDEKQRRARQGG